MGKTYKVTTIDGDVVYGESVTNEREIIVNEWYDDKGLIHRREVGQELVRCKECVHNGEYTDCPLNGYAKTDDSFCSYGERKDGED